MYTFVMMARARKLIKMLSPNNASLFIGHLVIWFERHSPAPPGLSVERETSD
jgi:hypothetical protein